MKTLSALLFTFVTSCAFLQAKEIVVPDKLDLDSAGNPAQLSLPSPNEISHIAKNMGMQINSQKGFALFKGDIKDISEKSRIEAVFLLGRMFSVAGLSYEDMNNNNIMVMSKKLYDGLSAIELPQAMRHEIDRHYNAFLKNPDISRSDLIMAFTESRSSLMAMLNDPAQAGGLRRDLKDLALSMELGLWFQSLGLALDTAKSDAHLDAIVQIFLIKDVLSYFDTNLKSTIATSESRAFLNNLLQINHELQESTLDGKISTAEKARLQEKLKTVLL